MPTAKKIMKSKSIKPATVTLLDGAGNQSRSWTLNGKTTYYIGRGKSNDISLPVNWISRKHAMIQVEENGVYNIIDLGSSNGTMINGKRQHTATRLLSGDKLQVGSIKTTLVFLHDYTPAPNEIHEDLDEETVAFLQTELVTIMVCDIRNFTSLSEKIGAESISSILSVWSNLVNEIVTKNNGTIDKFIGDAVMAIWVGNEIQSENIYKAMKTALAISKMTSLMSSKFPDLPWQLKLGGAINTGEAVMGNVGVEGGRDFTVVGDVVNVTFRLEELTTKTGMDILLGANVLPYLSNKKELFTSCKYIVKGKKEPVPALGCSFDQLSEYLEEEKD